MKRTQSEYSRKYSFKSGQSQEDILAWELTEDIDKMYRVRDLVASSPGLNFRIFDKNPLHLGYHLYCIEQGSFVSLILTKKFF